MVPLLAHLHDRQEACYLVTELATQIVTEEAGVTAKLQYIDRLVKHANKPMMAEDAERMRVLLLHAESNLARTLGLATSGDLRLRWSSHTFGTIT